MIESSFRLGDADCGGGDWGTHLGQLPTYILLQHFMELKAWLLSCAEGRGLEFLGIPSHAPSHLTQLLFLPEFGQGPEEWPHPPSHVGLSQGLLALKLRWECGSCQLRAP